MNGHPQRRLNTPVCRSTRVAGPLNKQSTPGRVTTRTRAAGSVTVRTGSGPVLEASPHETGAHEI